MSVFVLLYKSFSSVSRFEADTKIANSEREYKLQKAAFDQEVNTAKADAELAYELQAAKEKQAIRFVSGPRYDLP